MSMTESQKQLRNATWNNWEKNIGSLEQLWRKDNWNAEDIAISRSCVTVVISEILWRRKDRQSTDDKPE